MDKVLFFDGYCSLCNHLVDSMIRWDKKSVLKFASLQSDAAKKNLPESYEIKMDPDTVIYLRVGRVYDRSSAILFSLYDMGGPWVLAALFFLVPKFLRDLVYRFVAKIRYKVFGKRETCRLPTAEEQKRILP